MRQITLFTVTDFNGNKKKDFCHGKRYSSHITGFLQNAVSCMTVFYEEDERRSNAGQATRKDFPERSDSS